jgi:hypothetical protein
MDFLQQQYRPVLWLETGSMNQDPSKDCNLG